MKLHHPIYLEDRSGRFLVLNGEVELGKGIYYYTGISNGIVFIHSHKAGDKLGTTVYLRSRVEEFEAVHALVDLLIEGMGVRPDDGCDVAHIAFLPHDIQIRVQHCLKYYGRATISSVSKYGDCDSVGLPYNKTGLRTATNLLRIIK